MTISIYTDKEKQFTILLIATDNSLLKENTKYWKIGSIWILTYNDNIIIYDQRIYNAQVSISVEA